MFVIICIYFTASLSVWRFKRWPAGILLLPGSSFPNSAAKNSGPWGLVLLGSEWQHYSQHHNFLPHLCREEKKFKWWFHNINYAFTFSYSSTWSRWFYIPLLNNIPTDANCWQNEDVCTGRSCVSPVMLSNVLLISMAAPVIGPTSQESDREHVTGQAVFRTARVNYQQCTRTCKFHCASCSCCGQRSESRTESCDDVHDSSKDDTVFKWVKSDQSSFKSLHLSLHLHTQSFHCNIC